MGNKSKRLKKAKKFLIFFVILETGAVLVVHGWPQKTPILIYFFILLIAAITFAWKIPILIPKLNSLFPMFSEKESGYKYKSLAYLYFFILSISLVLIYHFLEKFL